ncbi:Cro/CI family transcriptional regulator [uncultured Amphritea sp.]|uniref:Cro/CI family transcriptional regulator n=1 Tax=uncultured Amphritea sp. TaxID=981605 RepID=UPI002628F4CF|nr:Cro/CI family transcriptional regulator [uncultured Amphritea sp.]
MQIKIKTEDAINYFGGRGSGGVTALAEKLDITHGAVSQWGEYLPKNTAYTLYFKTNCQVKAEITKAA